LSFAVSHGPDGILKCFLELLDRQIARLVTDRINVRNISGQQLLTLLGESNHLFEQRH
jgi:hypothetical protein